MMEDDGPDLAGGGSFIGCLTLLILGVLATVGVCALANGLWAAVFG